MFKVYSHLVEFNQEVTDSLGELPASFQRNIGTDSGPQQSDKTERLEFLSGFVSEYLHPVSSLHARSGGFDARAFKSR